MMSITISAQKRCSVCLVFSGRGLGRGADVLVTSFVFVCLQGCPTHCFCFVFRRLLYLMLPFSLDCPFLISPSVISNVYLVKLQRYFTFDICEIPRTVGAYEFTSGFKSGSCYLDVNLRLYLWLLITPLISSNLFSRITNNENNNV